MNSHSQNCHPRVGLDRENWRKSDFFTHSQLETLNSRLDGTLILFRLLLVFIDIDAPAN